MANKRKPSEDKLTEEFKHCDDYIRDFNAPKCLRVFLLVNRMPAIDAALLTEAGFEPKLFADYEGKRVKVTMASRLGDVGISEHLDAIGYNKRVPVEKLSNFGDKP